MKPHRAAAALLAIAAMAHGQPTGQNLYLGQCSFCHGQSGEGGRGAPLARPKLRQAPDDETLRRIVRRGIPGTGMPGSWLNEAEARLVADYVRGLGRLPAAVVPGDASRGETIYNGKGGCAACHTIGGRGGAFGPDLTGIGSKRSAAHLRASVADPAAEVARDFLFVRAVTRAGRTVEGVRVNEDSFSIQVREVQGALHSFWKAELRELKSDAARSAMPGYRGRLSEAELDDLAAYLAGLREAE